MDELPAPTTPIRTPGIVIFAAILSLFTSAAFFFLFVLSALMLLFGGAFGIYVWLTDQIQRFYPGFNLMMGLNMLFGFTAFIGAVFLVFFLIEGVGLLRGKRFAWYFQVAISILGLLNFPVGTVINGVILAFFFRPSIRNYFQV